MVKVAVLGDLSSIQGFSALGLEIFPCSEEQPDQAVTLFRRLCAGGEYGVIYIIEEWFSRLEAEIQQREDLPLPAVIPIPGVKGNTGAGKRRLSRAVERAVGADILFG